MIYLSIQDITDKYRIKDKAVRDRVKNLGIKGIRRGKKLYFNEAQVSRIKSYTRKKIKNDRIKITIIEEYIRRGTAQGVFKTLHPKVGRNYTQATVREWLENDHCIVVDSKMNED